MKPKFKTHVLALLLLTGCVVADDVLKQLRFADEALKTAQQAKRIGSGAKAVEEAERALQHTQRAREAHRALQSAPDAKRDQIKRALQQIEQIEYEAQFIKLEAQANNAVAATTRRIKTGQGELASANDPELNAFLRDLLCLNLQTVTNERKLPSDEDYQEFLLDHAITRFVPVWEIKEKAESIIKFAESTSKPGSDAELQARMKIVRECNFRRSGK